VLKCVAVGEMAVAITNKKPNQILEDLLKRSSCRKAFHRLLASRRSEEILMFWSAVEEYKKVRRFSNCEINKFLSQTHQHTNSIPLRKVKGKNKVFFCYFFVIFFVFTLFCCSLLLLVVWWGWLVYVVVVVCGCLVFIVLCC